MGALCPYDYFPRVVRLTDDEMVQYVAISRKIGGLIASGHDEPSADESDEVLQALLMKRARLVGAAANKLTGLAETLRPLRDSTHNLIYCGDGRVEFPLGDSEIRQVEAVQRLVGGELGMRANTYLGETSLDERDDRRRRFSSGELQALIAIRCLDEGVDIPATRRAFFLASSANPKQWIQRRVVCCDKTRHPVRLLLRSTT
jgi:superfamily II DNA or RNA helicase